MIGDYFTEILILLVIFIFVIYNNRKSKKRKNTNFVNGLNQKLKSKDETISNLTDELNKLKPTELTEEAKKNMKQYGDDFEKKVGQFYEDQGFIVDYRGLELGMKDEGIDLIAVKGDTTFLIQCKYWVNRKVKPLDIKEFYGNCNFYLDQNENIDRNNTICIFALPSHNAISKEYAAYQLFKKHFTRCQYKVFE